MEQVKYFKLKIVTPEKIELLNDKVKFVKVKTINGDLGILPNHMNFMSSLGQGLMEVRLEDKNILYFINGGFLEINNNYVTLLAHEAIITESEEEVKRIKAENLRQAIERKKKEDQGIVEIKKRLHDSLKR